MKITPLDIQQVAFKIKMRGYDRQEVDSFLDSVTEDYEEVIRDNNRFQEKIVEFENQVSELNKKESGLLALVENSGCESVYVEVARWNTKTKRF